MSGESQRAAGRSSAEGPLGRPLPPLIKLVKEIPFLLRPRQLAPEAGWLLIPQCPSAAEGGRSRALRLALPEGQQDVANPQLPGHLAGRRVRLVSPYGAAGEITLVKRMDMGMDAQCVTAREGSILP